MPANRQKAVVHMFMVVTDDDAWAADAIAHLP